MNNVNEKTMSSLEVAHHTGKSHKEVLADIKEVLGEMLYPEKETGIIAVWRNRKVDEFQLSKLMCYRLVMRYERDEQDAILCEWEDIEYPVSPERVAEFAALKAKA